MMRLRYSDIQTSRIPAKLGVCADSTELMAWTNDFQQRALAYGRWWGTFQLAQFCVQPSDCSGTCIVLPREVAVIEAANLNGYPIGVQGSSWGQFVRPHLAPGQCRGSLANNLPCTDIQNFRCGCGCGCSALPAIQDEGMVASFSVTRSGERIKLYATQIADYGKKVVIQGNDSNGIWVRTTFDGAVQDGEQVTLAAGGVLTNTTWGAGAPYAVYKEATSYRVLMFAVDADSNERQLADYQPTETNPTYRKVRIPGLRGGACGTQASLRALVSLQHIPITNANDWLLFTNLAAYSDGIFAEKFYENGDKAMGDAYFFGQPQPARNGRGVLRVAMGMGALPILQQELRKQTADKTATRVHRDGLLLQGFV